MNTKVLLCFVTHLIRCYNSLRAPLMQHENKLLYILHTAKYTSKAALTGEQKGEYFASNFVQVHQSFNFWEQIRITSDPSENSHLPACNLNSYILLVSGIVLTVGLWMNKSVRNWRSGDFLKDTVPLEKTTDHARYQTKPLLPYI